MLLFAGGEGELGGIEEILPDDICCCAQRRQGIEVGLCHPDTEGGVLLSEGLSGGDRGYTCHRLGCCGGVDEHVLVVAAFAGSGKMVTDEFADTELEKTGEEGADDQNDHIGDLRLKIGDYCLCDGGGEDGDRGDPEIKRSLCPARGECELTIGRLTIDD